MAFGGDGSLPSSADVVVVGAGVVGASVGARLAASGVEVLVVDRAGPAGGTSSAGEGNLLVSDKLPGPELELALLSLRLWGRLAEEAGGLVEFDRKGGLVVAADAGELEALLALATAQQRAGVRLERADGTRLAELEPQLSGELVGGVRYPDDCQLHPMLAVAWQLRRLAAAGGRFVRGVEVTGAERDREGRLRALRTSAGSVSVGTCVVDAAGPWSGELSSRLGGSAAVVPRRGHVLVSEPVAPLVRHKVYEAGYVASIHGGEDGWACSAVVESTVSGTMLLGSSREFVGFSPAHDPAILAAIAASSIRLVPALAGVRLLRAYVGFRPATPDRLPVIGDDADVGGLVHATGHEGAGVGLAPATAELVAALVLGEPPAVDPAPFSASRFAGRAA